MERQSRLSRLSCQPGAEPKALRDWNGGVSSLEVGLEAQMEMASMVSSHSTTSRCILRTDKVNYGQLAYRVAKQFGTPSAFSPGPLIVVGEHLSSHASSCLATSAWTILGGYLSCLLVKGSRIEAGDGTSVAQFSFWGLAD